MLLQTFSVIAGSVYTAFEIQQGSYPSLIILIFINIVLKLRYNCS